jgi:hypothetical protein
MISPIDKIYCNFENPIANKSKEKQENLPLS